MPLQAKHYFGIDAMMKAYLVYGFISVFFVAAGYASYDYAVNERQALAIKYNKEIRGKRTRLGPSHSWVQDSGKNWRF